jgi:hypothetical protein
MEPKLAFMNPSSSPCSNSNNVTLRTVTGHHPHWGKIIESVVLVPPQHLMIFYTADFLNDSSRRGPPNSHKYEKKLYRTRILYNTV